MLRPIQVRAKHHAFFADFAQFGQAKNLESTGVSEDCARPSHEAMQSTKLADLLHSRPKIKVIGVAEQNLDAKFFENILRNTFHTAQRADRHEYGRFDLPVRSEQAAGPGWAVRGFDLKLKRHFCDCNNQNGAVASAGTRGMTAVEERRLQRRVKSPLASNAGLQGPLFHGRPHSIDSSPNARELNRNSQELTWGFNPRFPRCARGTDEAS
jgi:hypothetical protein